MKPAVALAALSLFALPLHAACIFNLQFNNGLLRWDPIPAAHQYRITEVVEGKGTFQYITEEPFLRTPHRVTAPFNVNYLVTADLDSGVRALGIPFDSCTDSISGKLAVDLELRKLTRKAILPVVASTAGANGGRFRTSLTMRGLSMRGRLVFHPAGRAASDSDPSIRYSFDNSVQLHFDDVVAAIGGSGLGSIDIIPDDDSQAVIPEVQAYLYNETPNGTFGTIAAPVLPYDYLHATSHSVTIPDSRFRVNAGFRTLTDTTLRILIFGVDTRLRSFHDQSFPAGWMQMTSAADLARTALAPGETMTIAVANGSAILFHTLTENATNDPTLVVGAPPTRTSNVGEYVD